MHDFHLADIIFKVILEEAEKNKLSKIKKATIELGSIVEHGEEILPENLKFNIKILAEGSVAEGIKVVINKIEGDSWVLKEIEGE